MKWILGFILLVVLGLSLLGYFVLKSSLTPETSLETPLELYQAGEEAPTEEGRQEAFNKALNMYLDIERAFQPAYGSGILAFNIANTYYQLQEYPWAVYYYYKALAARPQDKAVLQNLNIVLETLKLPAYTPPNPWEQVFLLKGWIPVPRLLRLFAIFFAIAFFCASWQIWAPHAWVKILLIISALMTAILALNLAFQYFFSPIEAIVIQSAPLYRGAGSQYAAVIDKPLPGGIKVEVLDIPVQSEWAKIQTDDDLIGFIPVSSIRMLYK